jgi:drug/metabolite transporter (DMT)-like permease
MRLSNPQKAILALIALNMIWGAAPPIFKFLLHDVHPFTLAFLRFVLPALIMFPFVKGKLKIHPKDYVKVFLIGFFGITINIIFFFQGLLQAPSINAALIGSSAPIFIVLCSLVFLKEKLKSKLITGALIGLCGVLLILITPLFKNGSIAAIGNFFYLISMFGGVVAVLLVRKIMKRNSPIAVTFWSFVTGSIGFIPFFIQEIHTYGFLPNINAQGIIGIVFGVLFSSLAAYFLQTWALKYLTAADVSVFTYIDPVVTLLVAAPLLGEFPDGVFVSGSVLVLLGIFMAEGRFHWHPFHLFLKK